MSDYAVPGQRTLVLAFAGDDLEILRAFADSPRSHVDQFVPMLRRKLVDRATREQPMAHPVVPGYDAGDPKAMSLDPGFNPDLARDIARGK